MDQLASCYFCGRALEPSLHRVWVTATPATEMGPSATLCSGCLRKLEAMFDLAAVEHELVEFDEDPPREDMTDVGGATTRLEGGTLEGDETVPSESPMDGDTQSQEGDTPPGDANTEVAEAADDERTGPESPDSEQLAPESMNSNPADTETMGEDALSPDSDSADTVTADPASAGDENGPPAEGAGITDDASTEHAAEVDAGSGDADTSATGDAGDGDSGSDPVTEKEVDATVLEADDIATGASSEGLEPDLEAEISENLAAAEADAPADDGDSMTGAGQGAADREAESTVSEDFDETFKTADDLEQATATDGEETAAVSVDDIAEDMEPDIPEKFDQGRSDGGQPPAEEQVSAPDGVEGGESNTSEESADDAADTNGGMTDGDTSEQATSTITALEYNKIMRLLQNREFPVERAEIVDVAASAYDLSAAECAEVIDLAVDRDLLDEDGGHLYRPEK